MKNNKNPSAPKKGQRIAVDPIRRVKDVKAIARVLSDSPCDHLLFIMGVNNGLRAGDLLKLKVKQVRYLKPGETLKINEGKTGKPNVLAVNKAVYDSLQHDFEALQPHDEDYLFKSKKGNNKPLTIQNEIG